MLATGLRPAALVDAVAAVACSADRRENASGDLSDRLYERCDRARATEDEAMSDMTPIRDPRKDALLTPENAVIAFIDYQPEQYAGVHSVSRDELLAHVTMLGKCGILPAEDVEKIKDGLLIVRQRILRGEHAFVVVELCDITLNRQKRGAQFFHPPLYFKDAAGGIVRVEDS